MVADPAAKVDVNTLYVPAVAAPPATFTIKTSFAEIKLFVRVNATLVAAANAALFMVIWPEDVFNVTPVDLLVAWVTDPWAAVE